MNRIRIRKDVLMGIVVAGVAILIAGCSTVSPKMSAQTSNKEQAVMCSKCQTVWVQRGYQEGKHVVAYRQDKQMVCPDCQSAILTFFKTGKLEHTCKSCGGTFNHCTVHQDEIASVATKASTSTIQKEQAATCAKCQMVWVRRAELINKTTVYRNEKVMKCPDCKSAVANFFTTGKWQHTCKACGENLSECAVCK